MTILNISSPFDRKKKPMPTGDLQTGFLSTAITFQFKKKNLETKLS